jgi:hypothetical protein
MRLKKTRVALGMVMAAFTLSAGMPGYILPASAQSAPELRKLQPQFVTEPGCPVEVVAANTELEVDPFGAAMAARHYIDYRNVSGQPVAAVKFRIGYVDDQGRVSLPYLNAPDAHVLSPGESASQKWRGEKLNPRTREVKIRVLMVKLADGSVWESQKLRESAGAAGAASNGGFQPLQTETAGTGMGDLVADRSPGTPVPLTGTGKAYTQYPQQTQTGSVPFRGVQTPAPGFEPSAFGGSGVPMNAPSAATPGGAAPEAWGAAPAAAPGGAAPWGGAPAAAAPAGTAAGWAMPAAGSAPAATAPAGGEWGAPGGASAPVGATASSPQPAPTFTATPPAPKAPTAADIGDPMAAFDKMMGNTSKPSLPSTIPTLPSSAPPVSDPAPAAAPAAAPASDPDANAGPSPAPAAAPAATPAPAPAPVAPAATPAEAPPAVAPIAAPAAPAADSPSPEPAGDAAPPATPPAGDPFGG